MGIARHRAKHRDKKEYCKIGFTNGIIVDYPFDDPKFKMQIIGNGGAYN